MNNLTTNHSVFKSGLQQDKMYSGEYVLPLYIITNVENVLTLYHTIPTFTDPAKEAF